MGKCGLFCVLVPRLVLRRRPADEGPILGLKDVGGLIYVCHLKSGVTASLNQAWVLGLRTGRNKLLTFANSIPPAANTLTIWPGDVLYESRRSEKTLAYRSKFTGKSQVRE